MLLSNYRKTLILFIVILFVFTFNYFGNNIVVIIDGNSMQPAFTKNQFVIMEKTNKNISRFDIVLAKYNKTKIVKRVVGVENDTVYFKQNFLYINDNRIAKCNILCKDSLFKLRKDEYFLIGDNYKQSFDSRDFGILHLEDIIAVLKT